MQTSNATALVVSQPEGGIVGCEWVVDAFGCDPEALRDLETLQQICQQILGDLELTVVGQPMWHQFPGYAGVTGLFLLSESHLACHTYPEHGLATFNLYCCRNRPEWPWANVIHEFLGSERVTIVRVPRGQPGDKIHRSFTAETDR